MTCYRAWLVYVSRGESAPIYQHAAHAGRAGGGMLTHPGQIAGFPLAEACNHNIRCGMRCIVALRLVGTLCS